MTVAVEWYLFNVVGWSAENAIGICTLPWILLCLHAILNETNRKMGYTKPGRLEYQILLMNAITAYATLFADDDGAMVLSSHYYSNLAVKVLSGYVLANGIGVYFFSSSIASLYGVPQREAYVVNVRKVYGIDLINTAVFQYGILAGMDNTNLLGLVWFIAFVLFTGLLKDFQRTEGEMKPIYAWWVTMFLFSVILWA